MNPTLEIRRFIEIDGIGSFVAATIFSKDKTIEVADFSFLNGNAIDYVLQSPVGTNGLRHNIYMFRLKASIDSTGLIVSQLVELTKS